MLAQPDHYGPRLFRTAQFPPAQRFGAWRSVVHSWLLPGEMRQVSDSAFHGSACLRVLPDLRFGAATLDGTINRRSKSIVSQDDDDLFLIVNSRGSCSAIQRGRETEIVEGGAYLLSCAEIAELRWPSALKLVALRTRRDAVASLVRNVYDNLGRVIPPSNENLRLLIGYLRMLIDSEPLREAETRSLVTRHLADLLALTLGGAGYLASGRGLQAARLASARAYVEQHLGSFELSPDDVALHLRVSPRTVQRLFESTGASFSGFVLERRLARAHAALGKRKNGAIGEIAFASGFNNISYFNRTFRARYGVTPSDVRNSHLFN